MREEFDMQVSLSWLPLLNVLMHTQSLLAFVRTTQQISLGTLVTVKLYLYLIMLKNVNLKLYDQMSTAIHGVLNEH